MKIKDILINICLIAMAIVGSMILIRAPAFRQNSVADSGLVRGKYVQREMESFLKSKPKISPEAVTGKELSVPKEITTVPEGSK